MKNITNVGQRCQTELYKDKVGDMQQMVIFTKSLFHYESYI